MTALTIERYDQELIEDINTLQQYVAEQEDLQKDFMRSFGTPEKTIEEVSRKARTEGRPISDDGSGAAVLKMVKFLEDMVRVYDSYPFRMFIGPLQYSNTNVLWENDWFELDTRPLSNEERQEYARHWRITWKFNRITDPTNLAASVVTHRCYPSGDFVKFVANLLIKYGAARLLSKNPQYDKEMEKIWKDLSERDWESSGLAQEVEGIRALREHLEERGYSPVPMNLLSVAKRAIALANQGKHDDLLMLPEGTKWTVAKIIKELQLESFLS
ncbi:hypothetical protein ACFLVY_01435 [Chloroflexota bacterium]